jgi:hypothetical protein
MLSEALPWATRASASANLYAQMAQVRGVHQAKMHVPTIGIYCHATVHKLRARGTTASSHHARMTGPIKT